MLDSMRQKLQKLLILKKTQKCLKLKRIELKD